MREDTKKKKVLVIDDDPVLIKLMKGVLESNGFEPIVASEAPKGLELAMTQSPDLVILDVMMPIINGYNVCRLLKSEDEYCNIPVILLTSRSEEKDKEFGTEVGADAYISKPFDTQDLINTIRNLLN